MDNPIHNGAERKELKPEAFVNSTGGTEKSRETSASSKDPDTILSVIVLLLACLGLAALAHVFV
jgi:hypothetical protein